MQTQKFDFFFKKVRNSNFDEELKSPKLRQYQSYISNWYINGKVFTSTTAWKPKNLIYFKSSKFEFWLLTKSWNHLSFVNISPTLVIDTSIEWSPRVLHHGNPEMWIFFKKFEIDEIEFCPYIEFPYAEKKKSPWLRQYQSYISNWYVNGKVFTSTTTWEPKNLIFFFKKVRNWIRLVFWLVLKSWNHSSRSQHAPICRHRGCIVVPLRVDI